MSVDALLEQVAKLTEEERAEFRERLDEDYPDSELSPELCTLLDARTAAADANPNAGYTIEEVLAYVKRKK